MEFVHADDAFGGQDQNKMYRIVEIVVSSIAQKIGGGASRLKSLVLPLVNLWSQLKSVRKRRVRVLRGYQIQNLNTLEFLEVGEGIPVFRTTEDADLFLEGKEGAFKLVPVYEVMEVIDD